MSTRPFGFVRKLPSGRFQASYVGPDSNRYNAPGTFKTKTDARDWLAIERASILAKTWVSPVEEKAILAKQEEQEAAATLPKFKDYAERHIEVQTNHYGELLRESTKALYKRLLATKLQPFHDLALDQVNSPYITDWWAASTKNGERTSASKAYKLLSAVMKRAVEESLLKANPCKVKGAQSATSGRVVTFPTPKEVVLISEAINSRYRELVLIKAYSGLRFGEITELRRKDLKKVAIPTQNGSFIACYEISISRAVTLVGEKHVVAAPKSRAGVREIIVSSIITPIIDAVLASISADPDTLLFPAAEGGHQRHDVFMNSWNPALKRVGLEDSGYTPHSLRHFAGSEFAKTGANVAEIKEWLGDSSTSAVMRYVHSTNRTASLVQKMENAF
jgi:integrase